MIIGVINFADFLKIHLIYPELKSSFKTIQRISTAILSGNSAARNVKVPCFSVNFPIMFFRIFIADIQKALGLSAKPVFFLQGC